MEKMEKENDQLRSELQQLETITSTWRVSAEGKTL